MTQEQYDSFRKYLPNEYEDKEKFYQISLSPLDENEKGSYTEAYGQDIPLGGEYVLSFENNVIYISKSKTSKYRVEHMVFSERRIDSFVMVDTFGNTQAFKLTLIESTDKIDPKTAFLDQIKL